MSARPKYRDVQGDKYLLDMRLHNQVTLFPSTNQIDGLAKDLDLLSHSTNAYRHRSEHAKNDHYLSNNRNVPCDSTRAENGFSRHKSSSNRSTISSSSDKSFPSKIRKLSSSPTSACHSLHAQPRRIESQDLSGNISHQAYLDRLPTLSMLDRWCEQTARQDPFHGLASFRHREKQLEHH